MGASRADRKGRGARGKLLGITSSSGGLYTKRQLIDKPKLASGSA